MRIRMLLQMSGPRGDGQAWPGPHFMGGGTLVVSDSEGQDLVRAGIAEEAPEPEPAPVKAPRASKAETRAAAAGDAEEERPAVPAKALKEERAVATGEVEDRAPSGLTTQNTPVTRPRAARGRAS